MANLIENQLSKFTSKSKIINRKILSNSFNMRCEKISLKNNKKYVIKYYTDKKNNFNSIKSETLSLLYLLKKFPELFPSIKYKSSELLITEYIENNNIKHDNYQEVLANEILKLHRVTNYKYGFEFDAQIGGLRQPNNFQSNWVNFFRNNRLMMIFDNINLTNPMPNFINKKIEFIIKNLESFLPARPKICLLHGDLWQGNILFNNGKLEALIDPGIFFGHNELEVAYLTFFKFIDNKFIKFYSNFINIDKDFKKYEPIYQLYYCLLNVYLWERDAYIKKTEILLKKIF